MLRYSFLSLTLWLTLLGTACTSGTNSGACRRDIDCPTNFVCGSDNQCQCISNESCLADEYCNERKRCQKFQGCRSDNECPSVEAPEPANFRCASLSTGQAVCLCKNNAACKGENEFCDTTGTCKRRLGCIVDAECGSVDDFFCRINVVSKVGECFCKRDQACEKGKFCNEQGYCQAPDICTTDSMCPIGKRCELSTGVCLCRPEEVHSGCATNEVCNPSGYCQPRPPCFDNKDCKEFANTYCDFTARKCVPNDFCAADARCPLGQICATNNKCQTGCRSGADCPLDKRCVISGATSSCEIGCQEDGFCPVGSFCQDGQCQSKLFNPTCATCNHLNGPHCGADNTGWCLIYPYNNDGFGSADYCAPACSKENKRCPSGLGCGELTVVSVCTVIPCPPGVPCLTSSEGDAKYCPCHDAFNPCSQPCINGKCQWDNKTCSLLEPCPVPECVKYGSDLPVCPDCGRCVIGYTCGLQEGVHCPKP